MKRLLLFAVALALAGCAAPASTALSPLQKREITTQRLMASPDIVFRACITVLQDQGYVLQNVDPVAGLIVATAQREYLPVAESLGLYRESSSIELSCMVTPLPSGEQEVRFSICEAVNGQVGYSFSASRVRVQQVYDPGLFARLFHELTIEVQRLQITVGR